MNAPGQHDPEYQMKDDESAEAMLASMKLNGIDRLWFVSGYSRCRTRSAGATTPAVSSVPDPATRPRPPRNGCFGERVTDPADLGGRAIARRESR
jgi:hypothetical protein